MKLPRPRVAALLAGAAVAAIATAPAHAQVRRAQLGRFEIHGLDFRPDGTWRRHTREIRERRLQLLANGRVAALNPSGGAAASGAAVTGAYNIPVLLVRPNNIAAPFPGSDYQTLLFTSTPGPMPGEAASPGRPYSIRTYYEEVSNYSPGVRGITLNGTVVDWFQGTQPDTYYEDGCNGVGVTQSCPNAGPGGFRLGELFVSALHDATNGADDTPNTGDDLDWGQFDNDGPDGVPNSGDDDGYVDFVAFIQPEVDGACGTTNIWAHRWVLSGVSGSEFVTTTPSNAPGGGNIKVEDYTVQSGLGGASGCTNGQRMAIGTMAHETGHAFGLPDLYDTQGTTEGIGEWGLMGSGNYARSYSPGRMEAWSLVELGWVDVDTLGGSQTIRLEPVATGDRVLMVPVSATEWYLLENRQAVESDSAQMNPAFGTHQKSPGLLVWQVDQSLISSRTPGNTVNTGAVQGLELIQADDADNLHNSPLNRGDMGDAYPGSTANRRLSATSGPALLSHAGVFPGFAVDSIYQDGLDMVFRYIKRDRSVFASAVPGATVKVDGVATGSYDDIVAEGDQVALDADENQVANGGRSRFVFASWSNGGARTQTVTSGASPDTVLADFTAEHRLDFAAEAGGGTVAVAPGTGGTLPPGFASGGFLPAGTAVVLTATPPAGQVFHRWTGDTTATGATLELSMERPYNVTAEFTGDVNLTLAVAVNAILGTGTLTAEQTAYLDDLGNGNGSYDVGDFLAYLDDSAQTVSPETMRRVLSRANQPAAAPAVAPKEEK